MPLLCAFDERIETLYAMGPGPHTLPEFNWNDTVIALCKFPSGRMIQLQTDIFSYRPVRCGYFLQGTKGCFEYDRATVVSDGGSREGEAPAEPPSLSGWKSLDELQEAYQLTDLQADYRGHGSAFERCVRDFMAAIENETPPPLGLSDALHITAIGWAIDESLTTGNTVKVISF